MSEGTQRDPHRRASERRTLLRTIPLLAGRRGWLRWVAPAVVLLLVVSGLATWYRAAREPSLALDQLTAGLDAWPGVTYRGRVSDGVFDPADVVATVNRAGNAHGTIARDGGHAEFAVIGADQFIKADRAWWEASDPTDRDRFTGVWLRNPGGQFGVIPSLLAAPGQLVNRLRTSVPWHPEGPQQVDGVPARAYSAAGAGGGRLLVASDAASDRAEPRLLAVEPPTGPDVTARLAVARPDAAALAAIDTLAPQLAGAANYWDMVLARAQLSINTTFPPTPCATRTCPAFIQLTNSGTLPAPGRLEAWMDGTLVQTFPVVAAPGSTQNFTAYGTNPFFSGGRGTMHWQVRIRATAPDD